jgi:LDH2 family malate/lactate/ureidoglycolate dehydrogenase
MSTAPRSVPVDDIEELGQQVLRSAGMTPDDARTVSRHLALASLRGVDSHGLVRYLVYARRVASGGMRSPSPITTIRDGGQALLIDGGDGVGQVVGQYAIDTAVERARRSGVCVVSVCAGNHLGALAPYTLDAADRGCIGVVMTNASPRMAPAGGAQALLGNNPWSIAVPGPDRPVVMDMANSVAALGKVRLLQARGEPLPEGWARDDDGLPTTDPQAAITGLLEPIAGYKGYVIALMVDLLAGALSGGGPSTEVGVLTDVSRPGRTSHLFLAIDVEHLVPLAEFRERVGRATEAIRTSRRAVGSTEILVPGDLEARVEVARRAHGVPLTGELATALRTAAEEFSVPLPSWLRVAD